MTFRYNEKVVYVGNDPTLKGKYLNVIGKSGALWMVKSPTNHTIWKLCDSEIKRIPNARLLMDYEEQQEKKAGVK